MKLNQVFKILKQKEAQGLREGYRGDAAHVAWQRYVLEFLIKIAGEAKNKRKRKPTTWNLFAGQYLREGKTLKQASEDYREKKK